MRRCIIIAFPVFVSVLLGGIYFFAPRHVNFEFVQAFDQPIKYFDRTNEKRFDYVYDQNYLWWWLKDWYLTKDFFIKKCIVGYDSTYIESIARNLDFDKYDYIITYQRELTELKCSPYLSHKDAASYFDKRTPLIPVFKETRTTKVYIYKIKKNGAFRSPGP